MLFGACSLACARSPSADAGGGWPGLAWTGLWRLGPLAGRRQRIPFPPKPRSGLRHVTLRSAALLLRGCARGRADPVVASG